MIGIDYNLFWTLNPTKIKPFIRAFNLKQEREQLQLDTLAWNIGGYVISVVNAVLSGGKETYPQKPRSIENSLTDDEKQQILEEESKKYMEEFAQKFKFNR